MSNKKMLIIDSELMARIDENRGELNRDDFLNLLIDEAIGHVEVAEEPVNNEQYLQREEFEKFTQEMKEILKRFLDFFVSSDGDTRAIPQERQIEELTHKFQSISRNGSKVKNPR